MIDLSNRTALITGAGRGIGRGCAVELARAGADIVINDRPGSPDLKDTADAVRSMGRSCVVLEHDVFQRESCERLLSEALAQVSQIDILISNPAFSRRSDFLDFPPELFEQVVAGTLTSGFHMSQLVARHMVNRHSEGSACGGKIVFISSVQGEVPIARSSAYGASKAGLNHLARSIAVELAMYRINVNVIEPGWIDTPGEHVTFSSETIRQEGQQLPWGRLGQPAEIGKAAAFLASDAANYITGSILPVDGLFRYKGWRAEITTETETD